MATRSHPRPSVASFCPPTIAEPADADASLQRPWVLVDKKAYIANRENATTARAPSSGGHKVQVSTASASQTRRPSPTCASTALAPRVTAGTGAFPASPSSSPRRAPSSSSASGSTSGPGRSATTQGPARPGKPWVGSLPQFIESDIKPCAFGVLPCGSDDGKRGFVVAALVPMLKPGHVPVRGKPLELVRFASAMRRWHTMAPRLDPSCGNDEKVWSHETGKVIVLGGGFLGWVDLWRGILVCNVLDEYPEVSFIPLPKPTVPKVWKSYPGLFRDVTSCNNLLSFVEIQLPKTPYDDLPESPLFSDSDSDSDSEVDATCLPPHGWRATKWERMLFTSDSSWKMDCSVGSADTLVGDPGCYLVLPELRDAKTGNLTLENLSIASPVLTKHDDGVVYMVPTLENTNGQESWVTAFDLRTNALKALAPWPARRTFCLDATCCTPCSFSKYLIRGAEPCLGLQK
ncbi:hypothetical protein EJB05_03791, partial [Eragrostis curvula]